MPYRRHLDVIRVAEPCTERWDRMDGDERVRFCMKCEKNVYHLSTLTPGEIEDLVRFHEGDLCVRFALRADGTVVTAEPPTCADARDVARGRAQRRALVGAVGAAIGAAATAIAWVGAPSVGHEPAVVVAVEPPRPADPALQGEIIGRLAEPAGVPAFIPGKELAPSLQPYEGDIGDLREVFPEFTGGFGGLGLPRP